MRGVHRWVRSARPSRGNKVGTGGQVLRETMTSTFTRDHGSIARAWRAVIGEDDPGVTSSWIAAGLPKSLDRSA